MVDLGESWFSRHRIGIGYFFLLFVLLSVIVIFDSQEDVIFDSQEETPVFCDDYNEQRNIVTIIENIDIPNITVKFYCGLEKENVTEEDIVFPIDMRIISVEENVERDFEHGILDVKTSIAPKYEANYNEYEIERLLERGWELETEGCQAVYRDFIISYDYKRYIDGAEIENTRKTDRFEPDFDLGLDICFEHPESDCFKNNVLNELARWYY